MRRIDDRSIRILSRATLLRRGMTGYGITRAVRSGRLFRIRRDHYTEIEPPEDIRAAIRVGGRVGCVSALQALGVFVMHGLSTEHIHIEPLSSRLRGAAQSDRRLCDSDRTGIELHWAPLLDACSASAHTVSVIDALVQAAVCQPARMAVATLDSALFLELVDWADIDRIFAVLPAKRQVLKRLLNGRCESGAETLLALILRQLGYRFEVQRSFAGIGRVDFLVEGCLVIEVDSRSYHEGWANAVNDRTRDLKFGALGLPTLRPLYQHIVFEQQLVRDAIRGIVEPVLAAR
ncbi:hypothetical protein ACL9RL_01850 [Plantibacter sp. Mn2098]|uniref:hypothetical protein n=1 Tax=Plantibacter sp. Mn2098 TaxID=3395266 RepID=UPI003BE0B06D